jgi:hypothetical protein
MTDDLVSRLSEILDKVEWVARRAHPNGYDYGTWVYDPKTFTVVAGHGHVVASRGPKRDDEEWGPMHDVDGTHIAVWDPVAVLPLIAAIRKVISDCEIALEDSELAVFANKVIQDLAAGLSHRR